MDKRRREILHIKHTPFTDFDDYLVKRGDYTRLDGFVGWKETPTFHWVEGDQFVKY